jgi:hypothetical protein
MHQERVTEGVGTACVAGPVRRNHAVRGARRGPERENWVEILVEPGRQVTDELLLAIATGTTTFTYFDRDSTASILAR